MIEFPENLKGFINSVTWTFAKTMLEWPHEYIVRKNVNEDLFIKIVIYIRENGYVGKFYTKDIIYFEDDGLIYWTMGNPVEDTTIINRTKKENSYEVRFKKGTLPKDKKKGTVNGGTT